MKLCCRSGGEDVDDDSGGTGRLLFGTCWNVRLTSEADMRKGAVGGGVSPSSDLTSWRLNGTFVRSSAMAFSEFTEGDGSSPPDFDHTILRCSGSGAREGDSFALNVRGDLVQVPVACGCGGVIGTISGEVVELLPSVWLRDKVDTEGSPVSPETRIAGDPTVAGTLSVASSQA